MSRTLFWYVFKDLLRIFLLTTVALAGIMSFGGLLKPLTEHGLNVGQVLKMLGYFMPAMTTYSLPVAALFATTMVYGRLGADNEITACRAAGISFLSMTIPAAVLGFLTFLISVVFLLFVVPKFTLQVEHVIYSNLAQLTANQIERNHRITFDQRGNSDLTIFADRAEVLPPPEDSPRDQIVRLHGPMIMTMEPGDRSQPDKPRKPSEFYTARIATAFIRQDKDDGEVTVLAELEGGRRFEREAGARPGVQVSIGTTRFQSQPMESPVRENTKFMDIRRLQELLNAPEKSRRITTTLREFIRAEQQDRYLRSAISALTKRGELRFDAGEDTYELTRNAQVPAELRQGRLHLGQSLPNNPRPIRLRQYRDGAVVLDVAAREVRMRCWAVQSEKRVTIELEFNDAVVQSGRDTEPSNWGRFPREFSIPMPPELVQIAEERTPANYANNTKLLSQQQSTRLKRDLIRLNNSVQSELHARASFALSCFILVMVGAALGMMFRSGNFLSAFAVSVVPALLSIVLIVTGQHTCENVGWNLGADFRNPLLMGLVLIWSGNAMVLLIGCGLLWRLQRT